MEDYTGILLGMTMISFISSALLYASIMYQGKYSILGRIQPILRPIVWMTAGCNFLALLSLVLQRDVILASVSSITLLMSMYVVSLYESKRKEK